MKVLLILSMVLIGCGEFAQEEEGETQAVIVEDEEGNGVGEIRAKLVASVPEDCELEDEGALVFVKEAGFYYCEQEAWHVIDLKGKDGEDGVDGKDGTNGKDGAKGEDGKDARDGMTFDIGWECDVSTSPLSKTYELGMKAFIFEFTDGSHYISCSTFALGSIFSDITEGRSLFYPPWYLGKRLCTALGVTAAWDPSKPDKIIYSDNLSVLESRQDCHEFPEER